VRRLAAVLAGTALLGACSDAGPEIAVVIEAPASTEVVVGDHLTLTATSSEPVPGIDWVSSDARVATVLGGRVEALRPGTATITASAVEALPAEIDVTVVARSGGYDADEIDYFVTIAFGAEFGTSQPVLRRWRSGSGPLIRVNGTPSTGDLSVLDTVIAEINRLAPVDIEIVTDFPTLEMHFVPQSQFSAILSQAPPGNIGLVWVWWDDTDHLYQSVVLIATDVDEATRAHIIREEVTQSLGLLRDSYRYASSIFFQGPSAVTEYLPVDRAVIELLYRPELSTGMGPDEASATARTLIRLTSGPMAAVRPSGGSPAASPWGRSTGPPVARGSAGSGVARR